MEKIVKWLDKYKKIVFFVGTGALIILTVLAYSKGLFTEQEQLERFLNECGIFAPIVFVIIQAMQVVVPILPGAVGCLYGVLIFGPIYGFLYNYIGICIGSIIAFLLARNAGQEFVKQMTGSIFFEKYSKYLMKERHFENLFALLIFLPVAPDDFLCYLAGISKMKLKKFTMIILLGKPAAIFLYSMGLNKVFQVAMNVMN